LHIKPFLNFDYILGELFPYSLKVITYSLNRELGARWELFIHCVNLAVSVILPSGELSSAAVDISHLG